MLSNLIKKSIVDKNGKHTTVRVRVDAPAASVRFPVIPTPAFPDPKSIQAEAPNFPIDGKRVVPTTISLPRSDGRLREWRVAPLYYSGADCPICGSYFPVDDEVPNAGSMTCRSCGQESAAGYMMSGIRYSELYLLDDEEVRNTDWYHITASPRWEHDILDYDFDDMPLVHLGSMDAAVARMNDLNYENGTPGRDDFYANIKFYCYKVRLGDDTPLSPYLAEDENELAPESIAQARGIMDASYSPLTNSFFDSYEMTGATRYVNAVEGRGSISLIAHAKSFSILERIEL